MFNLKIFKQQTKIILGQFISLAVYNKATRSLLNYFYNKLSLSAQSKWCILLSKIFTNKSTTNFPDGYWTVFWCGKKIFIPLEASTLWLDWNIACAVLGHDSEIKKTYELLLNSSIKPKVFFDVGANYGIDSLLHLSQGVQVVPFEPNPTCRKYIERFCNFNSLEVTPQTFALDSESGQTSLYFPEREEWLGTINSHFKEDILSDKKNVKEIQVQKITLDKFVETKNCYPDLIKIDVEGSEIDVMQGSLNTLKKSKPLIIFESFIPGRRVMFDFFTSLDYLICYLSLNYEKNLKSIDIDSWLKENKHSNFIAIPKEKYSMILSSLMK